MFALAGLGHLSDKEIWLIAIIVMCGSFLIGWAFDSIMGRQGFGLIGNSLLAAFAVWVGAWTYNRYFGSFRSPDMKIVLAVIFGSVVLHLLVLNFLRRFLRLN
jgi:uncharacterized membrane protein YeaQ/YmgE (transglycosylase-associated protein family)